jgi:methionyl-tRNA synthetase
MSHEKEIEIRRMMQHFEHKISEMNSTAITEIAGDIRKSDFLNLAQSISVLRAKYLKDVLMIAHADKDQLTNKLCHEVKEAREAYQEAIESFDQLKHALQRGYFNLVDD